ncbi:calcium-binding protein, partial [Novimethylophilus kurashikiensis]
AAVINATGNELNNALIGNSGANFMMGGAGDDTMSGGAGNDTLVGGAGNDILTGGIGNDVFRFNTAPDAINNVDTITDFGVGSDVIQLENGVLTGLGLTTGTLNAGMFNSGAGMTTAQQADDHIIYDSTSGALYYDADGVGGTAAVQIATLTGAPVLTNTNFVVI